MPIKIEKLPDAPIGLFTLLPNSDVGQEMEGNIVAITALLDAQTEPIFLIYELHDMRIGLDDLTRASSIATRGGNAILHHPMVRESVFVVTDGMIKMALAGLTTATFGHVKLARFETVEDAFAYCREKAAIPDNTH